MAAYSSRPKRIKNALLTVLSGITYDAGGGAEPAFTSVIDRAYGEDNGYPIVRVLPDDVDSEKSQSRQDERRAAFMVLVSLPLETAGTAESDVYNHMYDLTELIIDAIEKADYDGTLNTLDSGIGTYSLSAQRGNVTVAPVDSGIVLNCDVNVQVRYSRNF